MSEPSEFDDAHLGAFLLGALPPDQSDRIQVLRAGNADFRALIDCVEEELFDDHARGRLRGSDAARFSSRYLKTQEGRDRLAFAEAFASQTTKRRFRSLADGLGMLAAVLVAVTSFQIGRSFLTPSISIDLRPGVVRETVSTKVLEVPRGKSVIEFRLYPDDDRGERASILTLEDREIVSGVTFALSDGGRKFLAPADMLPSGTYIIRLDHATRTVATFVVRLAKQ